MWVNPGSVKVLTAQAKHAQVIYQNAGTPPISPASSSSSNNSRSSAISNNRSSGKKGNFAQLNFDEDLFYFEDTGVNDWGGSDNTLMLQPL
jgi:hypothetical protein